METLFATAINCIDGRTQEPVISYIKETFEVDFVDMITEAGPNKILSDGEDKELIDSIKRRAEISVYKHSSKIIAVVGHYDCAGNPVAEKDQKRHLFGAISRIEGWNLPIKSVVGLWLDKDFNVSII